jgi:hypothetical protein
MENVTPTKSLSKQVKDAFKKGTKVFVDSLTGPGDDIYRGRGMTPETRARYVQQEIAQSRAQRVEGRYLG